MSKLDRQQRDPGAVWARHGGEWRDPVQAATCWREANRLDGRLLQHRVYGIWWEVLARLAITLIVTREYEHLVVALGPQTGEPRLSFLTMPHPSGVAIDEGNGTVVVASTRNPNQIYEFKPIDGCLPRLDNGTAGVSGRPLVPVASRFYPGCLYLHDLAFIGGALHANAVGQNAVAQVTRGGAARLVWWPRCVEVRRKPILTRNHIQLNSIAAGRTIADSYFSASADAVLTRRPGDPRFPVDRRGVIFSGRTRDVVTRGLTRPHSARLNHRSLWVANSGYGELCRCDLPAPGYTVVTRLPGWTRGLCFRDHVAFVGTSRVLTRFRAYAPGLAVDRSVCGVHAVDIRSGSILGGIVWPYGNQIFAVECVDRRLTTGFPFAAARKHATARENGLFYAFNVPWGAAEVG
jgi:uncharacterized protein (TIGR03032 family)